jgi:hypothetical protein
MIVVGDHVRIAQHVPTVGGKTGMIVYEKSAHPLTFNVRLHDNGEVWFVLASVLTRIYTHPHGYFSNEDLRWRKTTDRKWRDLAKEKEENEDDNS